MPQPSFQPGEYLIPCPRCAGAVRLPRGAAPRFRSRCGECGFLVTATWTDNTIVLGAFETSLPRRDAGPRPVTAAAAAVPGRMAAMPPERFQAPPRPQGGPYPPTPMQPVTPMPVPRQAPAPAFTPIRFEDPSPDGAPDWEGARRRVSRAMNGLR